MSNREKKALDISNRSSTDGSRTSTTSKKAVATAASTPLSTTEVKVAVASKVDESISSRSKGTVPPSKTTTFAVAGVEESFDVMLDNHLISWFTQFLELSTATDANAAITPTTATNIIPGTNSLPSDILIAGCTQLWGELIRYNRTPLYNTPVLDRDELFYTSRIVSGISILQIKPVSVEEFQADLGLALPPLRWLHQCSVKHTGTADMVVFNREGHLIAVVEFTTKPNPVRKMPQCAAYAMGFNNVQVPVLCYSIYIQTEPFSLTWSLSLLVNPVGKRQSWNCVAVGSGVISDGNRLAYWVNSLHQWSTVTKFRLSKKDRGVVEQNESRVQIRDNYVYKSFLYGGRMSPVDEEDKRRPALAIRLIPGAKLIGSNESYVLKYPMIQKTNQITVGSMKRLILAVAALHSVGLVHGDIRGANIIINHEVKEVKEDINIEYLQKNYQHLVCNGLIDFDYSGYGQCPTHEQCGSSIEANRDQNADWPKKIPAQAKYPSGWNTKISDGKRHKDAVSGNILAIAHDLHSLYHYLSSYNPASWTDQSTTTDTNTSKGWQQLLQEYIEKKIDSATCVGSAQSLIELSVQLTPNQHQQLSSTTTSHAIPDTNNAAGANTIPTTINDNNTNTGTGSPKNKK
jgi:hypothetical protein